MSTENPVYIKLEYQEALQAKRSILNHQISLLKAAQAVNRYKTNRAREIELKSVLLRKIRELRVAFGQLQKELPKPKIPQILKEDYSEISVKGKGAKPKPKETELEEQLYEIQKRLNELQSRA